MLFFHLLIILGAASVFCTNLPGNNKRVAEGEPESEPHPCKKARTEVVRKTLLDFPIETVANIVRFLDPASTSALLSTSSSFFEMGKSDEFCLSMYHTVVNCLKATKWDGEPKTCARFATKVLEKLEQEEDVNKERSSKPVLAFVLAVEPVVTANLVRLKDALVNNISHSLASMFERVFICFLDPALKTNLIGIRMGYNVEFHNGGPLTPLAVERILIPLLASGSPLTVFKSLFHIHRFADQDSLVPLDRALRTRPLIRSRLFACMPSLALGFALLKHGFFTLHQKEPSQLQPLAEIVQAAHAFFVFTVTLLRIPDEVGNDLKLHILAWSENVLINDLDRDSDLDFVFKVLGQLSIIDAFLRLTVLVKFIDPTWSLSFAGLGNKLYEFSASNEKVKSQIQSLVEFSWIISTGRLDVIDGKQVMHNYLLNNVDAYSWCHEGILANIWNLVSRSETSIEVIDRAIRRTYQSNQFPIDMLNFFIAERGPALQKGFLVDHIQTPNMLYAFLLLVRRIMKESSLTMRTTFNVISALFLEERIIPLDYFETHTDSTSALIKSVLKGLVCELQACFESNTF